MSRATGCGSAMWAAVAIGCVALAGCSTTSSGADASSASAVSSQSAPEGLTEQTRALFSYQATRARQYYERALSMLPDEDRRRQRSGLIMAAIYQSTLAEIEKDGYRILEHRVVLTPLRKLWIAWTTALLEHRRRATRRRAA